MTPVLLWGGPFDGYCLMVDPANGGFIGETLVYWYELGTYHQAEAERQQAIDPVMIEWVSDTATLYVTSRCGQQKAGYILHPTEPVKWILREICTV